jgi:hypothetical protein
MYPKVCLFYICADCLLFRNVPDIVHFLKFLLSTLVNKICWYCKCGTDRKYTETNNNVYIAVLMIFYGRIRACKEIWRVILDLRFTITLVKRQVVSRKRRRKCTLKKCCVHLICIARFIW